MRLKIHTFSCWILSAILLSALINSGCSGVKPVTKTVRFAILGNTSPDSPFSGFNRDLPDLLNEIENRKPQIIIHTGNAIYGGTAAEGILESDIRRQLDIFFPILKKLHTAVYTIPGERDYYNGTTSLFSRFSGKKSGYSFNYGSIHFICLSSSGSEEYFIDEKQFNWLKNDLMEFKDSNAIFVFAYNQLFPEGKKIRPVKNSEELHRLFLEYNVKAVFSGAEKDYSVKLKDSIRYINAGCSFVADKKSTRKNYRFYIINYFNNEIDIDPVK